ncbi:MAG: hypothetical protein HYX72_10150, partial [Acidobacteria bacterium]|nr:hypothetical protein [Acidobacteriota bacterium]
MAYGFSRIGECFDNLSIAGCHWAMALRLLHSSSLFGLWKCGVSCPRSSQAANDRVGLADGHHGGFIQSDHSHLLNPLYLETDRFSGCGALWRFGDRGGERKVSASVKGRVNVNEVYSPGKFRQQAGQNVFLVTPNEAVAPPATGAAGPDASGIARGLWEAEGVQFSMQHLWR